MKKVVNVSIEARMTSTRLPGKVLMQVQGTPLLQVMIERVKRAKSIDNIIIATTTNDTDDLICELAEKLGVLYYRGGEHDVLQRVLEAHKHYGSEVVVELTGDCPFIDPLLIDMCVDYFLSHDYQYVTNGIQRTYPDGFGVQVYSVETLELADSKTTDMRLREHVTPYMYQSGEMTMQVLKAPPEYHWPELSITLDTMEDYQLIKSIYEYFSNNSFTLGDVISLIRERPGLLQINSHIQRKGV